MVTSGETISEELARLQVGVGASAPPPPEVVARAALHVADTVGVAVGGSALLGLHDAEQLLGRVVPSLAGSTTLGAATIWASGERVSVGLAALFNGMHAHAEDFDDTHTGGIVHGSACVVPAAWAAAEQVDADGAQLLDAVVVGWETAARIGLAADGAFHSRGWHTTSIAGVFGATAAVGRLWGLDLDQLTNAFGLAGSLASGINAYLENGSRAKALHPGWAAFSGLMAVSLAQAGLTGPTTVFEAGAGLFAVYGGIEADELRVQLNDWGERWEMLRVSIKPYPACHFAHASIEGALQVRDAGVAPADVASIWLAVPPATYPLICDPWVEKLNPISPYAAKFSLPYLVATALVDGEISRESFNPDRLLRSTVRELMQLIHVEPWEDSPFPASFPARMRVETVGGTVWDDEILINRGHPERYLPSDEISKKLRSSLEVVYDTSRANAIANSLENVATAANIGGIFSFA